MTMFDPMRDRRTTDQELSANYPHVAGIAECFDCQAKWVAVWPLGAAALECPSCSSTNTDREQS